MRNVCPVCISPILALRGSLRNRRLVSSGFLGAYLNLILLTSKNYFYLCVFVEDRSLGAGLTGSCELLGVGTRSQTGQQEEQEVLLAAEPSLKTYLQKDFYSVCACIRVCVCICVCACARPWIPEEAGSSGLYSGTLEEQEVL